MFIKSILKYISDVIVLCVFYHKYALRQEHTILFLF